jgi:hypothetical protein
LRQRADFWVLAMFKRNLSHIDGTGMMRDHALHERNVRVGTYHAHARVHFVISSRIRFLRGVVAGGGIWRLSRLFRRRLLARREQQYSSER